MLCLLFIAFIWRSSSGSDVGYSMIVAAWLGVEYRGDAVDTAMMPLSIDRGRGYLCAGPGAAVHSRRRTHEPRRPDIALIDWAQAIVGRVRGSLGHVSILTNLIMAGVSGSAVADAVATGKPLIPAMRKEGYGAALPGGSSPPARCSDRSSRHRFHGGVRAIASQSVVKAVHGGSGAGLLLAAGFMVVCSIVAGCATIEPDTGPWAGKAKATGRAGWALLMP